MTGFLEKEAGMMLLSIILAVAIITVTIVSGQAYANQTVSTNAVVGVFCPFSISMNAVPTSALPSNVNIYYDLRTISGCSIPTLYGTFNLINASGLVNSISIINTNVITVNSLYVVVVPNSILRYGEYNGVLNFSTPSVNSSFRNFLVLSPILSNSLSIGNIIVDQGQHQTITETIAGGTSPFTYNFIVYNALGIEVANALFANVPTTSNSFTFNMLSIYGTGQFTVNVIASDNSIPSNTVANKVTFASNSIFYSSSFYPFSAQLSNTSSQILIADIKGGTPQYNYNFYVYNASGVEVYNKTGDLSGTEGTAIFQQKESWGSGVFTANLVVTDSATTSAQVTNTTTYNVVGGSVTTSTTTIPQSSGSGGGGGGGSGGSTGGGGGVQRPTCLALQNGYVCTGIAQHNTFNVTIFDLKLNFTDNFITPTSTGITINNHTYLVTQNKTFNITQDTNPSYIYTVQLFALNLTPRINTASLLIQAIPSKIPVNISSQNATYEIITYNSTPTLVNLIGENTTLNISSSSTAYQQLTIKNLTSSNSLPQLPPGYVKELIQQINVSAEPNQYLTHLNTTIGVSVRYNCDLPFYQVVPFILANYSWTQIKTFTVDSQACTVTLTFKSDPILAVTRYLGKNSTTGNTIPTAPIITRYTTTTIIQNPNPAQTSSQSLYLAVTTIVGTFIIVFIGVVMLLTLLTVIVAAYERRKTRNEKEKERRWKELLHKNLELEAKKKAEKILEQSRATTQITAKASVRTLRCTRCNHPIIRVLPSMRIMHGTRDNPTILCLEEGCECSRPKAPIGKSAPKPKPQKPKGATPKRRTKIRRRKST